MTRYLTYSLDAHDPSEQEIQDGCELLEKFFGLDAGSVIVTVEDRTPHPIGCLCDACVCSCCGEPLARCRRNDIRNSRIRNAVP